MEAEVSHVPIAWLHGPRWLVAACLPKAEVPMLLGAARSGVFR
jgi:hypothetical protein